MAQETQTRALYQSRGVEWGGRWEGGSKGRVCMYTSGVEQAMFNAGGHVMGQVTSAA